MQHISEALKDWREGADAFMEEARRDAAEELTTLNVWGDDPNLVDSDNYCVRCERLLPFHYQNCDSRRQGR